MVLGYLRKHIGKETTVETKDHGVITGKITSIDSRFNITIDNPTVRGRRFPRLQIRGSRLRSFFL